MAKTTIEEQLVKYLEDTHALEQHVLKALDSMISTTDAPELLGPLQEHRQQTEAHLQRLEQRLQAHGAKPTPVKEAGMIFAALGLGLVHQVRDDDSGKHARDGYVAEHLEIAAYEMLQRVAARAGDTETADVARRNLADEEAMAKTIAGSWDLAVDLSLKQEGVVGAPPPEPPRRMSEDARTS
jgi:ferritin-like metal-binding protein YciE